MPKILHCIWSMNTGGIEEMLIDIMTEQAKEAEVHLMIINDDFDTAMVSKIPKEIKIHYIRRRPGSRSLMPMIKANLLALRLRPDAIHLHNRELPSIILPKTKWHKIETVHDIGLQLIGQNHVNHLVAISDAVQADIKERYNIDSKVIINGINTEKISMREPKPYGKTMNIVQVGRLYAEKKGQDILIKAVASLRKRGYNDLTLTFIGDGTDKEMLSDLANREGVDDIVKFLGMKDKAYVYEHLRDYDLMVHPARWEGFGLVIAEAMSAQVPVAVPVDGGPYEVTDNGRLATTFSLPSDAKGQIDTPSKEAEACADAIANVHDNYEEVLSLAKEAREYSDAKYSIRRTVAEYGKLYETL